MVASVPMELPHVNIDKADMLRKIVELSSNELDSEEKEQFFSLLAENADIFAMSKSNLGHTTKLKHNIHTGTAFPIRQSVRRLPPQRRQEVQQLLADMIENEVVQPSSSPWASPIVLVRKKDNSFRFCVDYRKLNNVTHKDAYPLPRIDDTLSTLSGSKWFSTIDLLSGYWQVDVAEEDRPKTAFCTTEGLFEFKAMPFGLCNAPATFQRLMDLVLAGLQWSQCLVYLDDVIIIGHTFSEHLANLSLVFQRLRAAGLKLQPKKCDFLKHKVTYLGHVVSDVGVSTDPSKVEKVASWPVPTTTKEVQQFLGLAGYYRRFIQDFAEKARPLHRLTERNAIFKWSIESQNAFETLKTHQCSAPVLAYPDFNKPFLLDTDASDTGIGAVLSQPDEHGRECVIAYASRLLSKPERRYCVTRRELLAVVAFTKHFRHFLIGRHFTLRTDHGSLTWLKNFREPEGQMARWLERLQEFDFTIFHRPGKKHTNADALSRLPCRQCGRDRHCQNGETTIAATSLVGGEDIGKLQQQDNTIGPVLQAKLNGEKPTRTQCMSKGSRRLFQIWDQLLVQNDALYRQYERPDHSTVILQQLVPESKRDEVLRELHEGTLGGHLGEDKTIARIKECFYWPGYHKDTSNWCKTCSTCCTRKTPAPKNRALLQSIKVGSPLQVVAVDIVGPLPESDNGNAYILVVGDYFTRWMEAYPIPNQEAVTFANVITNEFFFRFSPPEQLHSDQGKQFESQVIAEICKLLGIKKTRTTPYHPQSDGLVERFNRTLIAMLSTAATDHPFDWEAQLRPLCMAYNTSIHTTTGYSPFFLMYGRKVQLPLELMYGGPPSAPGYTSTTEYATQLKITLQEAYQRVREKTGQKLDRQKELYDEKVHGKPYSKGDLVWLHTTVTRKGTARKFHHPWTGPFLVIKRLSEAVYRLQHVENKNKRPVVHFDRLKLCPEDIRLHTRPQSTRSRPNLPSDEPPPIGTNLTHVPDDPPQVIPPPLPRYPQRHRQAPDRLILFISSS